MTPLSPEAPAEAEVSPYETLIDTLPVPEEERLRFKASEIVNIEAHTDRKWVVIALRMQEAVTPGGYRAFADHFRGQIPDLARFILDVHYPERSLTLKQYIDLHRDDLFCMLAMQAGVTEAWLTHCRIRVGGREMVFELPNDLVKQELESKRCPRLLGDLLKRRCGWDVNVFFEVGKDLLKDLPPPPPPVAVPPAPPKETFPMVVFGGKIAASPKPMNLIKDEEPGLVVEGEIVDLKEFVQRTGRRIVTLTVSDATDSVDVKVFHENDGKFRGGLKEGHWVRVRGDLRFDERYAQDYVLNARDIVRVAAPRREDAADIKRVELHCHTQMSRMDSVTKIVKLVETAARWGHPALAVTDHGVVQAYPEAKAAAKKAGLKLILGMEGYLVERFARDKNMPIHHMVLLVKDRQGLKNLYRLVSESHMNHFYKRPLIPRELLARHREGLLVGSACEQGEVWQALLRARKETFSEASLTALREAISFYDYIEVMPCGNNEFLVREGILPGGMEELQALTKRLYETAKAAGKTVVATGDAHFLEPDDEVYRRIIQAGLGFKSERQAPLYFKTTGEMLEDFRYFGEEAAREVVVDNPRRIADLVTEVEPLPTETLSPHWEGADESLVETARRRARELYGDPLPPAIEKRLSRELDAIVKNRFSTLYVIAMKLVRKSLDDGYIVGSRGSVGSSLAAYLCGITEVNPLPPHWRCGTGHHHEFPDKPPSTAGLDLPPKACPKCGQDMVRDGFSIAFEVFMGFKGDKMPDIDLNFSGEYQHRAHRYVEELFGSDSCFRAGTISSVMDRIAYGFVRKYLEETQRTARNAEINRLVKGCSGVAKTTGQHPGGIVILPKDIEIYDVCPIQHPADRDPAATDGQPAVVTTHFDFASMHDCLVKLDILGHDNPTSLKHLEEMTGVSAVGVPLNDPETMSLFSGVKALGLRERIPDLDLGTLGVPEFGTGFAMGMLRDTHPTKFEELVRLSGLAHGTDVWLGNAQDLIKAKTATLSTVISTRDDMLNDLVGKGMDEALAFKIMESVRKGKGLTPEWEKSMKDAQVPAWYVDSAKKIKYIFPKAHAVAYCIMSFRIAWFKVHHPLEFYCDHFTNKAFAFDAQVACGGLPAVRERLRALRMLEKRTAKQEDEMAVLAVVEEFYARGLRALPVDLYRSDASRFLPADSEKGRAMRPPLIALPGLGGAAADAILSERGKSPFSSVEDLVERTGINKNVVEILRGHGCLKGLPESEQISLIPLPEPKEPPRG
jgi:DNA polymerase-3 subunit alpha (Gram-positive type)